MLFSWSFFFLGGDWVPNENCLGSPSPPPPFQVPHINMQIWNIQWLKTLEIFLNIQIDFLLQV